MKDTQKGFIVPLLIEIVIFDSAAGGYVYMKDKQTALPIGVEETLNTTTAPGTQKSIIVVPSSKILSITTENPKVPPTLLKSFTHSSGAFSFEYPTNLNLVVLENKYGATIAQGPFSQNVAEISGFYKTNIYTILSGGKDTYGEISLIKTSKLNGYTIYEIFNYNRYQYIIPLEDTANPSSFFAISILPKKDMKYSLYTHEFVGQQFDSVFKSLSIDKIKMSRLNDDAMSEVKDRGLDALIRTNLGNLKLQAEIYYDIPRSYNGLCINKEVASLINSTKTTTGSLVSCFDSLSTWAASAPLKSTPSMGYCVDSTGFLGSVSSSTIGLTGKCK